MDRREYLSVLIGSSGVLSLSGCTGQLEDISNSTTEAPPEHKEAEDPWRNFERNVERSSSSAKLTVSGEATLDVGEYASIKVSGPSVRIMEPFLTIEVNVQSDHWLDVYTLMGDGYSVYQDRKLTDQSMYGNLSQEGTSEETFKDGIAAGPNWVVFDNTKVFGTSADAPIDFTFEIVATE